jgi:hypothetical protein
MNFIFPYIGKFIIPTDFYIFQMGRLKPPTRYTYIYIMDIWLVVMNQPYIYIYMGFPLISLDLMLGFQPEFRSDNDLSCSLAPG